MFVDEEAEEEHARWCAFKGQICHLLLAVCAFNALQGVMRDADCAGMSFGLLVENQHRFRSQIRHIALRLGWSGPQIRKGQTFKAESCFFLLWWDLGIELIVGVALEFLIILLANICFLFCMLQSVSFDIIYIFKSFYHFLGRSISIKTKTSMQLSTHKLILNAIIGMSRDDDQSFARNNNVTNGINASNSGASCWFYPSSLGSALLGCSQKCRSKVTLPVWCRVVEWFYF